MRRNLKFALVSVVFCVLAQAQTLPPGVQKVTAVEGITEYSLPNGLHVLLFPDPSKPKVTVNMTYLVGSRIEGYGETGMAHLLEHMLFKTTKGGRDVKKDLTDHGAEFNGSTSYDRTNYFETVNASDDNLKWAIGLEADRMVNIRMEKALLDTEMTVVRNEFEMGENSPFRILMQRTMEAAYTFHNYGKSTIGNRADIEHVPMERLAAFYQKYYQPDDAVLTIAGQFDESKALADVVASFGGIPRPTRKLEPTYTVEPTQDGERTVTLRRVGDNQILMTLYHVPAATHPDNGALNVMAVVLGDNPSGRLYKALVENKKAVAEDTDMEDMHDPGYFAAYAVLREGQPIDEARDVVIKTVEGLASEPPSKEEVERAKARLLKQIDLGLTNSEQIGLLLSEYAAVGDWRLLFYQRDMIKKVTPEDVVRVAKAYLKSSNRTLGEFIPTKNPDRAEIPDTPDAATVLKDFKGGASISQGEAFVPTPSNIESRVERVTLPNGMKLVLLPKKTRGGVVVVQGALHWGTLDSLKGKASVGELTGALLMRGTKEKTRQQIQDEADKLKAQISLGGSATGGSIGIETVEAGLTGALQLAAECLRESTFPEKELEEARQVRIAGIENGRNDPQMLAQLEYQRHLNPYPPEDVRYVGTPDESIAELKKVTLPEVRQFYIQFYGGSNAELVVSGQFDAAEVKKLAADLFGNWKSPGPYVRIENHYHQVAAIDRKIETPDKQNAFFIAGTIEKMSDDNPEYPAMALAGYIFGGPMTSRLFQRIREKEGLSYGVGGGFSAPPRDDAASFVGMALSNPQNAPKVEAAFKEELARAVKDGFTAKEVDDAKRAYLEQRRVARSEDASLAGTLASRERWGRTMKWDEAFEAKIDSLTAEQVSAAFRKYVDPSSLTIVKAGDFKKAAVFQ